MSSSYKKAAIAVGDRINDKSVILQMQAKRLIYKHAKQPDKEAATGINQELDFIEMHARELLELVNNAKKEMQDYNYSHTS